MYRISSIALLIVGIALIAWGLNIADAFNSQVKEVFTGEPTDKAMWLYVGGGILALAGVCGLARSCCCKK
jgi:hypothetical protein